MKMLNYPVIAAVAGLLITSASQVRAEGAASCCSDEIAASPKVRATVVESCKIKCAAPTQTAVTTTAPRTGIAASPKVKQMRGETAPATTAVVSSETAGHQPIGSDGIAASPKVRAQLNERPQAFEIAPLK